MPIILPITLCACAAAAILNFWLAWRVGQLRGKHKVLHGDDGGGPLTRRMRAQLNFVENTPFVLLLVAGIELAGHGSTWLAAVVGAYMLARIAHGIGMDADTPHKARMIGVLVTMLTLIGLAVYAALIAARIV
ncbi:MAPEG family protein [Blastomonas marina]|jgi:uncharacterized protein|uniref:MAPEG family protein n=1 Tax=Blastomonas marina TaxID=1867408 RepID=A0ABQ1FBX6_9SPHN|nr:MAPEG family protein [Blastomonas marina]WPZ05158.1 MAPEG family protein [Blastomonas marina]GGA06350.1 hypothetical protein GCM10010923_15240 [Blastomonas marina]